MARQENSGTLGREDTGCLPMIFPGTIDLQTLVPGRITRERVWDYLAGDAVRVSDGYLCQGQKVQPTGWPCLFVVVKGSCLVTCDVTTIELRAGMATVLPGRYSCEPAPDVGVCEFIKAWGAELSGLPRSLIPLSRPSLWSPEFADAGSFRCVAEEQLRPILTTLSAVAWPCDVSRVPAIISCLGWSPCESRAGVQADTHLSVTWPFARFGVDGGNVDNVGFNVSDSVRFYDFPGRRVVDAVFPSVAEMVGRVLGVGPGQSDGTESQWWDLESGGRLYLKRGLQAIGAVLKRENPGRQRESGSPSGGTVI